MSENITENTQITCVCHGDLWVSYTALLEHQVSHYSFQLRKVEEHYSMLMRMCKRNSDDIMTAFDIQKNLDQREAAICKREQEIRDGWRRLQLLRLMQQREQRRINQKKRELRELESRFGVIALPDE